MLLHEPSIYSSPHRSLHNADPVMQWATFLISTEIKASQSPTLKQFSNVESEPPHWWSFSASHVGINERDESKAVFWAMLDFQALQFVKQDLVFWFIEAKLEKPMPAWFLLFLQMVALIHALTANCLSHTD